MWRRFRVVVSDIELVNLLYTLQTVFVEFVGSKRLLNSG